MIKSIGNALSDFGRSIDRIHLALMLGWLDIKQRYRRSKLGPFWITISMGVMIAMIGLVFGQVFKAPMTEYLPFLATGIILWNFMSATVLEGSSAFVEAHGMIRQLNLPLSLYLLRVLWRNIVICAHNMMIIPVVFLFVGKGLTINFLWVFPGLIILVMTSFSSIVLLGTVSTRFRDMPQIINSLLQVFFYVTPIIWMPNTVSGRSAILLVETNPIYHLLQLVRAPILGYSPTLTNWSVSLILLFIVSFIAFCFFGNYKKRIAYWL